MKSYTFVLNFGYVESSSLSYFPFTSTGKYRDAKEALLDLATFLKEQFVGNKAVPRKCCVTSKEKEPDAEFCSKCGRALAPEEFDEDAFQNWLVDMSRCDIDSFHGEFIDYDESQRWQSGSLEGAINQRFVYQAEWVIAAALGFPHGEPTFEDICSDRTKEKRESFSYY